MMQSFALFRLPHEPRCTLVRQTAGCPNEFLSCAELDGQQGFVVAPFAPSATRPVLLIRPDVVEHDVSIDDVPMVLPVCPAPIAVGSRADYHIDFLNFHARLLDSSFQKLVLSRCIDVELSTDVSPFALFRKACERYPRMMVSLTYTERSGLWLTATPEILLAGGDGQWQTVALAGTMPYTDAVAWSDKNIQEQRYVATYVIECLERFTGDFAEEGPRTVRAGHLAHLRSDFHFSLEPHAPLGELLQTLHPTPAVCGLPKQDAFRFILQNEQHDRAYYSGFMGPLSVEGCTSLFVTLRCMQLFADRCRLYAGGGLLKDSTEEQEWQETEAKLDTMRNLLQKT